MSKYNQNGESDEPKELIVQTVFKEILKSPSAYEKFSKKTFENVLKEVKKGEIYWEVDFDDPVLGAYYTVVQNHTLDEETKAIARINKIFNESELAKNGLKLEESQQLYIYRLYELSCNEQIELNNISVDNLNKIVKYADWLGTVGSVMEFVEIAGYAKDFTLACAAGNEKGVADTVANWIGSAACGFIAQEIAGALITAFAVSNPLVAFATFAVLGLIGSAIGDEVAEGWQMIFDAIFNLYDDAGAYTYPVDPLIFDLNGDGVKTVALADGVHFDFDKNGFAEKIGWVSPEDGQLVRDLDKNGKIDSGRELMGDLTELSDEMTASNGFEALSYFDTNADEIAGLPDIQGKGSQYSLHQAGVYLEEVAEMLVA